MPKVTVVDYGLGNLFSVARALAAAGAEPSISRDPEEILLSERVVLPGVGAFGDGMKGLRERGLVEPLKEYAASGRPLLGLCLGMQLFMSSSSEFGEHEGLGLIPGRVERLEAREAQRALKLPHIGWNSIFPSNGGWGGSVLGDLASGAQVYFVHSYAPVPEDRGHVLAECAYGERFCAAVRLGNITGCQFHPEKSAAAGLGILRRFVQG